MSLKLGVPSKGRLMDKTFDWFAQHGVELGLAGGDREYAGFVQGIENVELILLSAGEIPRELAAGRIHLGVTGTDLVRETSQQWENLVAELAELGFGQADLVLAVPRAWVDVSCLDDLDAVAAAFRLKHGFRLRIATKYHRLVREFMRENGSRIISLWTVRARPRARSRTNRPRRSPISPPRVIRCGPTI